MTKILVAGGGGFIGGHLVARLLESGHEVRSVDVKPLDDWYQVNEHVENEVRDLRLRDECFAAARGVEQVYNLAADMGGMGFIENNKTLCMLNVLIDAHLLEAAEAQGAERFFYASSACVYAQEKQTDPNVTALAEPDAYPADPEDGYGWEKLYGERLCRHFTEDFGLLTSSGRYHNAYGPQGTWRGGREKAPAAVCRKVATAKLSGDHTIEIWGDGSQTRSFTYIDDCVHGTILLANSDVTEPLNIGSSEMVTINQLVDTVADIAGIDLERTHDLSAPQGVRGRNSDNTLIHDLLDWQPSIRLRDGLERTYAWIHDQVASHA